MSSIAPPVRYDFFDSAELEDWEPKQAPANWFWQAGEFLQVTQPSFNANRLFMLKDQQITNCEVVAKARFSASTAAWKFGVVLGFEEGTPDNVFWTLGLAHGPTGGSGSANYIYLRKIRNGSPYTSFSMDYSDAQSFSPAVAADTWFWLKLRRQGQSIMGKYWLDGAEEPTDWSFEAPSPDLPGPGGVGLYVRNGGLTVDINIFEVTDFDLVPINSKVLHSLPGNTAQRRIVAFDWALPHLFTSTISDAHGDWELFVKSGRPFGVYYLSDGSAPQVHGPYVV